MKRIVIGFAAGVMCALCVGISALAADSTYAVEVSNNVDKKDVVTVIGVEPKSTVSVYGETGVLLGKKTAGSSATEVSVSIKQLGSVAGSITIGVLEKGAESAQTLTAEYQAEPVSSTPSESEVTITNNVDKKSTVYIENLNPKDAVVVYNDKGKKLASGKVGGSKDEITLNVSKNKLSKDGGNLYITVKSAGMLVSAQSMYEYDAQVQSDPPSEADVEITNNVGKKGTIVVSDLEPGDVITVYNAATGKKLGSKKCTNNKDEISVSATLVKEGGKVNITLKKANELTSEATIVEYEKQPTTPTLDKDNLVISTYPAGTKDTIYIENLEGSDVVKVYTSPTISSTLLKGTVSSSKDSLTLSRSSLTGEYLYISLTRKGLLESERLKVEVPAVGVSKAIDPDDVTIYNYAGTSSTVYITGLSENATITIYNKEKGGSTLATAKVSAGATTLTLNVSQLNSAGGTIWLTRKDPDCTESGAVAVDYGAQNQTEFYSYIDVEIVNNTGSASTITVSGLESGDVVKAYLTSTTGTVLASSTCGTYADSVTLNTSSLSKGGGTVYLTLTESGCLESVRTPFSYVAVGTTSDIDASQATITNNTGVASTAYVTGLTSGDVITAYSAKTSGTNLGTGTVASYADSVTFSLSSLSSSGGSIYLTRKSTGLAESGRVEVPYYPVEQSDIIIAGDITVLNNSGASDTVTVTGLDSGDVIKVYKNATVSTTLGTATASGGSAIVNISQLGTDSGSVWITRTTSGKTESARVEVAYLAESTAPLKDNITVVNNVTIDSTVDVTGLAAGDVVKVYSSSSSATPIGSGTVTGSAITIKVGQLSSSAGKVYVTVTNYGRCESSRTAQDYAAQQTTTAPTYVTITNNKDARATVTISGLETGDIIMVYSDSTGLTLLGSATVSGSEVTFTITSLGDSSGSVYISRTSAGKHESQLKAFSYTAAY